MSTDCDCCQRQRSDCWDSHLNCRKSQGRVLSLCLPMFYTNKLVNFKNSLNLTPNVTLNYSKFCECKTSRSYLKWTQKDRKYTLLSDFAKTQSMWKVSREQPPNDHRIYECTRTHGMRSVLYTHQTCSNESCLKLAVLL